MNLWLEIGRSYLLGRKQVVRIVAIEGCWVDVVLAPHWKKQKRVLKSKLKQVAIVQKGTDGGI